MDGSTGNQASLDVSRLYWPHPRLWFGLSVVVALLVLIFLRQLAWLDIAIADYFFTPFSCASDREVADSLLHRCGAFMTRWSQAWNVVRDAGFRIPVIAIIFMLVWLFWPPKPGKIKQLQDVSAPMLGLLSVIAGPLLAVNFVIKPIFGRPRPGHLDLFGGDWPFALPAEFSSSCSGNCSFVSGEAASAFWLLFILPFLPVRWRWLAASGLLLFALGVSLLRIAFGGHFLSDVVMAGMLSLVAVTGSAWFLQSAFGIRLMRRFCVFYNHLEPKPSS